VERGKFDYLIHSVVQRTLYLYRSLGSLNAAYQRALQEFYKGRREEEEAQLRAQKQEYTIGLEKWKEKMKEKKLKDPQFVIPKDPEYFFGRKRAKNFMEKERLELAEGLMHRKSLMDTLEQENSLIAEKRGRVGETPTLSASVKS
jgi:hypothetical protein